MDKISNYGHYNINKRCISNYHKRAESISHVSDLFHDDILSFYGSDEKGRLFSHYYAMHHPKCYDVHEQCITTVGFNILHTSSLSELFKYK